MIYMGLFGNRDSEEEDTASFKENIKKSYSEDVEDSEEEDNGEWLFKQKLDQLSDKEMLRLLCLMYYQNEFRKFEEVEEVFEMATDKRGVPE